MRKFVFVGQHGDFWSQMGAAIFNKFADPRLAYAVPAGLDPAPAPHHDAVRLLAEKGVRIALNPPSRLTPGIVLRTDILVALGCDPMISDPKVRRIDWPTLDSSNAPLDRLRVWRDELCHRIRTLLKAEGLEDARTW